MINASGITTPKIATIIVNYKAATLITENLDSLISEHQSLPGSTIIIVDNDSGDEDVEILQTAIEKYQSEKIDVELIAHDENVGFARGNNIALRALLKRENPPDFFFLLNPDAYVHPGAINELSDFLLTNPKAGAAGAKLVGLDDSAQRSSFRFFSIISEFETTVRTGIFSKIFSKWRVAPEQEDVEHETDWVCGAAVMMRREALLAAGLFDETYFLYYEETDLMLQMKRAGWGIWYVPAAKAVHMVGQSTGVIEGKTNDDVPPDYWFQSRNYFFRKNYGGLKFFLANLAWVFGASVFFLRRFISGKDTKGLRVTIISFYKNLFAAKLETRKANIMPTDQDVFSSTLLPGTTNENPDDIGYWALVREDLRAQEGGVFAQGFWALFNHRFGNWRMGIKTKIIRMPMTVIYRVWYKGVQMFAGIDLPYSTKVGRRVTLEHFGGMILVARSIGDDVTIRQNTTFGIRSVEEVGLNPTIGNHVDIGVGAVILGGVSIGDHAVIGANAVVLKAVPEKHLAVGVPARIINKES